MIIVRTTTVALTMLIAGAETTMSLSAAEGQGAPAQSTKRQLITVVLAPAQPSPGVDVAPPPPSAAAPVATPGMTLGVQTHFSQGWPATLVDRVRTSGATAVRDGVPWSRGEPTPGRYALDVAAPAALDAVCQSGRTLLLTLAPEHPAYDGGKTAHSDRAIAAFARYAGALADRYRTCLAGIEVGNEINDSRNLSYPAGVNGPARYVALVRATGTELRRRGSTTAVVGGSTNVIGTGFLDRLFAAGLLDAADAIAVHPYRSQAENVDRELANLTDVMRRHGRVLPIWATEFSDNYATADIAAEELVKMVTLLSAAGVSRAYWYALIDQQWFRHMGLYSGPTEKPAARAYGRMAALTSTGRATQIDLKDQGIRLYRFGSGAYVVWGGGGRVAFGGSLTAHDAYGRAVGGSATKVDVGPLPLIVTAAGTPRREQSSMIVADTTFGYGQPPWSYLAQTRDGKLHPLALSDGQWDSSYASRNFQPLRISDITAAVAGTAAAPVRAVVRYTSPATARLSIAGCFTKKPNGDGVDVSVIASGRTVWSRVLTQDALLTGVDVDLARGGTLDLSVGPHQTAGGDAFAYRVRLFARGAAQPVACPHRPQPVS
ncbi:glycosyl hydrolase [Sphingomonas radiodurans]|uniref:glycosyl hydrolase n=1 Tax=Sphingomonas radiodurans TaxID=2890321 RepID=UPI001E5C3587|nr:glycosyl hydrolase [Sphingomonas radiodurans]WBH17096.1 glycosyl hydrolase [Sphingomonas radiodurans]